MAEHVFVLKTGEHDSMLGDLRQYEPFLTDPTDKLTFSMEVADEMPVNAFNEELRQEEEGLHETENLLAQIVPVWHLDCLPDEAAARLCCNTCAHGA